MTLRKLRNESKREVITASLTWCVSEAADPVGRTVGLKYAPTVIPFIWQCLIIFFA